MARTADQIRAAKENLAIWFLRGWLHNVKHFIKPVVPREQYAVLKDEISRTIDEIKAVQRTRNPNLKG